MEYSYRVRTDKIVDTNGNKHTVYGIDVVSCSGILLRAISDVFLDFKKAQAFVKMCNIYNVRLVYLSDMLDDAIVNY